MTLCDKIHKCFISVLLLLLPLLSVGQNTGIRFNNITLPYSANTVDQVFQDSYGMMWFITRQGVFSFDGYTAQRVVGGNFHAVVAVDKETLCVGCDHGIRWLDVRTRQLRDDCPWLPVDGDVRALAYINGKLYVGTKSHGLFCLNRQSKVWQRYTLSNSTDDIIFSFCAVRNRIYIPHLKGLAFMDSKGNIHDMGIRDNVYCVLPDTKRKCLWIGTEHNLLCLQGTGLVSIQNDIFPQTVLSGSTYNRIVFSPDGRLMLSTEYGLQVFDPDTKVVETLSHDSFLHGMGLPSNRINNIFLDRQNNLWLATDRGVALAQMTRNFVFYPLTDISHSHDGNVFSHVLVDFYGGQWLGGDNGILHLVGKKVKWFKVGKGLRKNMIRSIYEDRDHDVWIATDASIARYNRQKDKFDYYDLADPQGRNSNWAYGICEDDRGRMWIATYMGGLYVVDKKALLASNGKYVTRNNPFAKHDDDVSIIYKILPGDDGLLWAYTSKGLASIDTRTMRVSLKKKMFLDAMTVADGSVWIDVQGHLYRYDIKGGKMIDMDFEVKDGMIYTLVKERNRVWMPTSEGLYYINTKDNTIHPYSKPDYELYAGVYIPSQNTLLWGGEDVIAEQQLNAVKENVLSPKVFITEVSVDTHSIAGTNLELSHNNDGLIKLTGRENVVISLATFDYAQSNSEVFWYKIGDKGNWQSMPAGTNRVSLPSIQGGTYDLYLSVDPNQTGVNVTKWKLIVPYPWYQRWWAWLMYVIIVLAILMTVINYYKRRNQKLLREQERENALALTQQKMEFFVDMSHELKTPLSLIIAPLEKLLSETTNTKMRARLKNIQSNALKLNDIIHRILDFKRMETESDGQILASHIELTTLLKDCISEFHEQADARNIKIGLISNVETLWIDVDVVKIQMVMRNLLSNALKYVSDNNGRITVSVSSTPFDVSISVSDNGPGVADAYLPKIFNQYFKGDNAHNGTGIGLFVVKKYILLHGGETKAKNDNGLTVSFSLPLSSQGNTSTDSTRPVVLIVDDNHEIVDFLSNALADNYNCEKAYSGEGALEKVNTYVPDIIITDQMMPEMDGTELCRQLRHSHSTANTPIIMLTAKDDLDTEMKSIGSGADVFMPKPFNLRKLQLHMAQLLKRQNSIVQSAHIETITSSQPSISKEPVGDEALMAKVMKAIDENISSEDFNVTRLCEIVGIDQKQLYRKMKSLTGDTPVVFLRNYRLKRAAELLKQGQLTVSEIMYRAGFNSLSYFTKSFKEKYGISPKEFRIR